VFGCVRVDGCCRPSVRSSRQVVPIKDEQHRLNTHCTHTHKHTKASGDAMTNNRHRHDTYIHTCMNGPTSVGPPPVEPPAGAVGFSHDDSPVSVCACGSRRDRWVDVNSAENGRPIEQSIDWCDPYKHAYVYVCVSELATRQRGGMMIETPSHPNTACIHAPVLK
jgi:hypothetical protein